MIEIGVSYPGAGPEEVETGILIKIEEALTSIQGMKNLGPLLEKALGRYTRQWIRAMSWVK